MKRRILLVDDEVNVRKALSTSLRKAGYDTKEAASGAEALEQIGQYEPDVMLLDLRMPEMDGMETLRRLKQAKSAQPSVIMMTAYGSANDVMEAMRLGAYDYVQKPFDLTQVKQVVAKALKPETGDEEGTMRPSQEEQTDCPGYLVGLSPAMQEVYKLVGKVSMTRATVLIQGESGTGKELIARAIHSNSPRADQPLIPVNCGAIPEKLLESELFGYERGAFTGAVARKPGLFEAANGGTLFLDEVGELTPSLQVKLLRVLQERTLVRLGGVEPIPIDVRIIAATNRDLQERIRLELFREDLYYRLNVVPIQMPPLRERKDDIPLLIRHFLTKFGRETGKEGCYLSPAAVELLNAYHWPGNVRQLENTIERAVVLASGPAILPEHVQLQLEETRKASHEAKERRGLQFEDRTMKDIISEVEKEAITRALQREKGNRLRTAKRLGISRSALLYKMDMYAIDVSEE
ncbi:sigma-54-dependent transcriptional regulator [Brevibacillus centrosporus]|uniref:Two-component system, NtrC family, response regulator AtoC n=1 Tax=Brevibacillus centrosporus TaxID=54910 RepID=A0A1I3QXY5_9BACL|nr:sigma-54 dependent transcriptional regulator [Brevibacillus centrosporus]MEC2129536.1 sigma-54 dependent transcriptional regulator [Brevibacillus centrosporus]RNB65474.1 sigma-54-dependent Fis family transcriptional regulator [Brevibacillus centrosporus]GED29890.1 acetoacetate metabolism regulatory protein AtoC [Brevibacillus centrosporus]SFJ37986.1 two-component system, NtrC family, response regulator AtoC [Brevibacillus centrosporus]